MSWVRLDDNFPEHPKVVAAGPICELIQIRAICYCSRHLPDGFLPAKVIPSLLVRLDHLDVEEGTVGDGQGGKLASFGQSAAEIDWPTAMVKRGLWHRRRGGYIVHDFLLYQRSRADVLADTEAKRKAGAKGAKSTNLKRWRSAGVSASADTSADGGVSRTVSRTSAPIPIPPNTPLKSPQGDSSATPALPPAPIRHDWPPGVDHRATDWLPGRWPYETFHHDCPERAWRGHCVRAEYAAAHPGKHPVAMGGRPKQCPKHREAEP